MEDLFKTMGEVFKPDMELLRDTLVIKKTTAIQYLIDSLGIDESDSRQMFILKCAIDYADYSLVVEKPLTQFDYWNNEMFIAKVKGFFERKQIDIQDFPYSEKVRRISESKTIEGRTIDEIKNRIYDFSKPRKLK